MHVWREGVKRVTRVMSFLALANRNQRQKGIRTWSSVGPVDHVAARLRNHAIQQLTEKGYADKPLGTAAAIVIILISRK